MLSFQTEHKGRHAVSIMLKHDMLPDTAITMYNFFFFFFFLKDKLTLVLPAFKCKIYYGYLHTAGV